MPVAWRHLLSYSRRKASAPASERNARVMDAVTHYVNTTLELTAME